MLVPNLSSTVSLIKVKQSIFIKRLSLIMKNRARVHDHCLSIIQGTNQVAFGMIF